MGDLILPASVAPWAIEPTALPLALRRSEPPAAEAAPEAAVADSAGAGRAQVAVVHARGACVQRAPAWAEQHGYAFDPGRLADRIEQAAASANAVCVLFDSPGGSVSGVQEAASRIADVSSRTLVVAVADCLMASAAYWLGASCTAVAASPSSLLGSVGVISVHVSNERMLDEMGIDVTVISAGEGKDDGAPFRRLSADAAERLQAMVDSYYAAFTIAVAAGRGLPARRVRGEWGAKVMRPAEARSAGMCDVIGDSRAVVARLSTAEGRRQVRRAAAARTIMRGVAPVPLRRK